jgi:alkylhydroperoxidase/carboxymuconolactone decarboxylase family protein YurZ
VRKETRAPPALGKKTPHEYPCRFLFFRPPALSLRGGRLRFVDAHASGGTPTADFFPMTPTEFQPDLPPPGAYQDFEKLGKACHWQGPLEPKVRELVKLGIALGAGLEGAARAHVRLGLKAGALPDEIRHAALLATTTLGFPTAMRSMGWIDDEIDGPRA